MIHSQNLAPIVLFTYNRPWHTLETLRSLQENLYAKDSILYVYSDGAKNESVLSSVQNVRQILNDTSGFRKVFVIEREQNYGLARSITEGVTEVIQKHGRAIVLEDDLVTSPYFLKYMNEALDMYQDEERVASIHAYSYPVQKSLNGTFFLKGADCWGWATWERAWNTYQKDGSKLLEALKGTGLSKDFNFNNSYNYIRMLKNQVRGKNHSWAITWYASCFLQNMYTLYPYPSLVKNIGHDDSGTHTGASKMWGDAVSQDPVNLSKIPVEDSADARQAFELFFRSLKHPAVLLSRAISKIKKSLKK